MRPGEIVSKGRNLPRLSCCAQRMHRRFMADKLAFPLHFPPLSTLDLHQLRPRATIDQKPCLRSLLKYWGVCRVASIFGAGQGARREHTLPGSVTDEQRSPAPKSGATLRARPAWAIWPRGSLLTAPGRGCASLAPCHMAQSDLARHTPIFQQAPSEPSRQGSPVERQRQPEKA